MRRYSNHISFYPSALMKRSMWSVGRGVAVAKSYVDVLDQITEPKNTFVLTDVDNTLLTTHHQWPSSSFSADYPGETYFAAMASVIAECPKTCQPHLFSLLMRDYRFGQQFAHANLLSPDVFDTFMKLRKMRVPVFGFTARGIDTCPRKHVKKLGLKFAGEKISPFILGAHDKDVDKNIYFSRGSVLLGGSCKGHGLKVFFQHPRVQKMLKKRDQVVFIDDKESNCEAFRKAANELGIQAKVLHFPIVEETRNAQRLCFADELDRMQLQADELQAEVLNRLRARQRVLKNNASTATPALWHRNTAEKFLDQIPKLVQGEIFTRRPGSPDPNLYKYQPKRIYDQTRFSVPNVVEHDLESLRQITRTAGCFTVVPYAPETNPELRMLHHYLYGMPDGHLYYGDQPYDPAIHPIKKPGLALHPGSPELLDRYQGEENPHMSWNHTLDKWEEYCVFDQYAHGTMLPTFLVKEERWYHHLQSQAGFSRLKARVSDTAKPLASHWQKDVLSFVHSLVDTINKVYQQGAYLKHVVGCYTADNETMFKVHDSDANKLAFDFFSAFNEAAGCDIEQFRQALLNQADNRPLILFECLVNPRNVVLSPHVDLDKTIDGKPLEVRVDTLRFNPVVAWPRHAASDFCLSEMQAAKEMISALKMRMPSDFCDMSFGADVAFVSGKPVVPDFNPGGDSGFLRIALQYQEFLHQLTGMRPPLISTLHQVFQQTPEIQREFISGLGRTVLAHPEVDDVQEAAIYLRNMYLMRWYQQGACAREADICRRNLEVMLTPKASSLSIDSALLLRSADMFFKKMGNKSVSLKNA